MSHMFGRTDEREGVTRSRSAATIDALLRAALKVLVDDGLPGFNTNAVAKAAGVSVATLYQHFPNKVAILRELFERNEAERTKWSISQMAELATTDDVAGWIGKMSKGFRAFRRSEVAGVELRRACRAIPELIE